MHDPNDFQQFNFYTELLVDTLKSQNKALLTLLEEFITTKFGAEYSTDILTASVFILAETDPDTCRWTLRNFYDVKLHRDITEGVVMFAAKRLIAKGFILGQDFSITSSGSIFINKYARAALMKNTSDADCLFIEEILQVVN